MLFRKKKGKKTDWNKFKEELDSLNSLINRKVKISKLELHTEGQKALLKTFEVTHLSLSRIMKKRIIHSFNQIGTSTSLANF